MWLILFCKSPELKLQAGMHFNESRAAMTTPNDMNIFLSTCVPLYRFTFTLCWREPYQCVFMFYIHWICVKITAEGFFFFWREAGSPSWSSASPQSVVIAESSHNADDGLINQTSLNKNTVLLFSSRPLFPTCARGHTCSQCCSQWHQKVHH